MSEKVLLIWCEVPEENTFYVFDEPTPEQLDILRKANASYIGGVDTDEDTLRALNTLSLIVSRMSPSYDHATDDELLSDFEYTGLSSIPKHDNVVRRGTDHEEPLVGPFTTVFIAGIFMQDTVVKKRFHFLRA